MSLIIYLGQVDNKDQLWSLMTDDIELIVGMLAASQGILAEVHYDLSSKPNLPQVRYNLDTNADVSSYRLVHQADEDEVFKQSENRLKEKEYGIWVKSSGAYTYDLYAFKTNSFFQGFISLCNAFQVDFRNYIFGLPFDGKGNQYALDGYVMTYNQKSEDTYDLDDVEEEEHDNENLIETLHKDY